MTKGRRRHALTPPVLLSSYGREASAHAGAMAASGGGPQLIRTPAYQGGMGFVPPAWLLQGVVLAATSEGISQIAKGREKGEDPAEEVARKVRAAQTLNNPFYQAEYADAPNETFAFRAPEGLPSAASMRGLGHTGLGTAIAAPISSAAITAGTSSASSGWLAAAGGPIGLAVGGATIALQLLWGHFKRRGARKVATTQIVDEVEPILRQNLEGYLNGPRTFSSQEQALANFDAAWQYVEQACGDPQMGTPGKWCVEDRQRGGEWDWFARYRDPIANDPEVTPDPEPGYRVEVDPETGERYAVRDDSIPGMAPLILGIALIGAAMFM